MRMDALARLVLIRKASFDYLAGASIRQIAKKYDVSYKTIYNLLEQEGIKRRRMGAYDGERKSGFRRGA